MVEVEMELLPQSLHLTQPMMQATSDLIDVVIRTNHFQVELEVISEEFSALMDLWSGEKLSKSL